MIKSGEISGRLEEVVFIDYAEHENDLIAKTKSTLTYPLFF